jgi:hypothetical protein
MLRARPELETSARDRNEACDASRDDAGMRFGLNFFPSFRLTDMSTSDYFALVLRLSERGDELGYHSVKTVEHYFHDYGGHTPNPIVLLSAIAARTRRIRPITGAVIPAFNNPIKLAGELAMLDNISNGRLDAGFGRAFIPKEFDVFGVSMEESRARFEEGIDIITRLWTQERVSYDGKFHKFRDVRLVRCKSLIRRSGSPRSCPRSRSSGLANAATTL